MKTKTLIGTGGPGCPRPKIKNTISSMTLVSSAGHAGVRGRTSSGNIFGSHNSMLAANQDVGVDGIV